MGGGGGGRKDLSFWIFRSGFYCTSTIIHSMDTIQNSHLLQYFKVKADFKRDDERKESMFDGAKQGLNNSTSCHDFRG